MLSLSLHLVRGPLSYAPQELELAQAKFFSSAAYLKGASQRVASARADDLGRLLREMEVLDPQARAVFRDWCERWAQRGQPWTKTGDMPWQAETTRSRLRQGQHCADEEVQVQAVYTSSQAVRSLRPWDRSAAGSSARRASWTSKGFREQDGRCKHRGLGITG